MHVHTAYLDEVAVLARERERERTVLMGRLLSSDGRDQQLVGQVATALRVDAHADFAVAVAPPAWQRKLREAAAAARAAGAVVHLHDHRGALVLVAELSRDRGGVPPRWLESVPCAVGPVARGLARVSRVLRAAEELAAALDEDVTGAVTLSDGWTGVAAARLDEIGELLTESVLSGLAGISEHERRRLLETVAAYCDSGSITAAARALFCHRNTVLNRLNRFAELTGHHPTRPREAATVLIALECARRAPAA